MGKTILSLGMGREMEEPMGGREKGEGANSRLRLESPCDLPTLETQISDD